ncbi:pyridoxamine 5'-phosphate oxidase family protein [Ancylobacter dichloromethanicus]|uniref:Pyridoxamine 5'-phosphate oxidase n=1 Tax=Ancylobacter dichloromethanicus TaxID=518825 RepID=A0A9W6N0I1_9HYPH|nr:pyridoxamine 5'-phosphate oxidase family protein [Ancylobacter dichloromethanicus]MBS7552851.1 pyridoxamine 5'-phosphate oxidase family protein [Ancylobacter dichloromethanicus]GLK73213.1 pyridoxamine 5'-phosphate oxidase [Ancylobacter dichloromethanicus]
MSYKYLDMATTPSVAAAQAHYGSAAQWARARGRVEDTGQSQRLGPPELDFIAARDGFYLASVSETGWPYVQYRGGPAGFLAAIDDTRLGFADFRGNRQYITTGNVQANDRVSLFLMDYAHRQRLKIFGRMRIIDAADDPALAERLAVPGYPGRVERLVLITVEAFDWNCPQHITPRFTQAELDVVLAPVREEIAALRRENERLRNQLQADAQRRGDDPESPA